MAKILIIEDDEGLAASVSDWLLSQEHETEICNTGAHGWTLMQSLRHDVILMDWDLPDTQGIDLLKHFRGMGGTTPVIMLTGRTKVEDITHSLDVGADDHIIKPFHVKELSSRINVVLRKSGPPTLPSLGTNNQAVLDSWNLSGTSLAFRYEFLDVIGKGAVGVIFKAWHPHLKKHFAIKMINPRQLDQNVLQRFEQEAFMLAQLERHPNIAAVHDFGVTERGQPFMVIDFVEGINLAELLAVRGRLPPQEALKIATEIASGVACAHAAGIIHRDLKPSNIMIQGDEKSLSVKLVDFGCAKFKLGQETVKLPVGEATSLGLSPIAGPLVTSAGITVGTPAYMSPEQATGSVIDQRTDVYALGCVLYEMLTGRVTYLGTSSLEVMIQHVNGQPEKLGVLCAELQNNQQLQSLVDRALSKNPRQRFPTMSDFAEAIEKAKGALEPQPGANNQRTPGFWKALLQKYKIFSNC